MDVRRLSIGLALVLTIVAGCGPSPSAGSSPSGQPVARAVPTRTLVIVDRHEPIDLAPKFLSQGGSGRVKRLFNAALAIVDDKGTTRPYMAESLPELHTDSWKVSPDGRMETIYRLRPNLTWQDGHELPASDFVFAWRVYASNVGAFYSTPQDNIEVVEAPDPRTLVIKWRAPYPDAATMTDTTLDPLPEHLLGAPFATFEQDPNTRDTFLNLSYWTNDYIGAGPYRLTGWQHGIQMDGAAFDGHALGRPKIDRIIERIMDDENTIMATVLAGDIQFAARTTLRVNHGETLKSQWESAGKGRVIPDPTAALFNQIQFRPEFLKAPALADARVRRALTWGIDKQSIVDVVYDGQGSVADTFVSRQIPYYAQVERAVNRYSFDPRRVEQGMTEAGFAKDRDGFFADGSGERFRFEFQVLNSVDYERVAQIMLDSWKRSGVEVQLSVLPNEQVRMNDVRNSFSGINMPGAGVGAEREMMQNFITPQIGTQANRWGGSNRGGWSNPQYDAAFDSYNSMLETDGRRQAVADAMRILSEDVPAFPLYYNIYILAVDAALKGPDEVRAPSTTDFWNIHEWYWSA